MSKAPAFQLYAADFYMDTASWTCPQVGAYFRLLMHEWVNGPLPNQISQLARIAGCDVRNMQKMWSAELAKKFTTDDANMYVNKRLELERERQSIRREIQAQKGSNGAAKRWKDHMAPAIAQAQPKDSSSSSSSTSIKTINKQKIIFDDGKFKNIPDSLVEKWKQVAPGIGIDGEIKKAELWIMANPEKKRSKWTSFLSNWMVRAQDNFIKYGGSRKALITSGERDVREYTPEEIPEISEDERQRNLKKVQAFTAGLGRAP